MSKVVLVTGASSGIGKSIALYLAEKGLKVYGTSRSTVNGTLSGTVTMLRMDVTVAPSIDQAISYLYEKEGRLDVLVNNAGIGMVGAGEDSSIEEMKAQFETNYFGAVRLMQAVLPDMRIKGSGLIINISSLAGLFGLPYRGVYSAAKHALVGLTESMDMELRTYGVSATVLCPGDFKTSIKDSRIKAEKTVGSVYEEEFEKVHEIFNREVDEAGDPIQVAKGVWRIIQTKDPKPVYLVASFFQKAVVQLRYWLPGKTFRWLMLRNYKMRG